MTRAIALVTITVLTALGIAGCASTDENVKLAPAPASPTSDAGSDASVAPIVWTPCDLSPGSKKGGAECALVPVPVDYANPSGPTIEVGVKRVISHPNPKAQLWLVEGGPGGSAVTNLQNNARRVLDLRPEIAVYALDHRGVGGSRPLECPAQQAETGPGGTAITDDEWPACTAAITAREAATLPHLTTSSSMRDLATMVDRVRLDGVPVIVHGISYGTYALLRFMRLFPQKVDGIVLEGISPPGGDFNTYDADMNMTAKKLFDACAADTTCRAHFADDPWKVAGEVVHSFDEGHCSELGLDTDGVRTFLGSYLSSATLRDLVPALVHRMHRCEARDVKAVVHFYQRTAAAFGASMNDGVYVNQALFFHIALSEMWPSAPNAPPAGQVLADWRKTTMSTGLSVRVSKRQGSWPTYARPAEPDATLPPYDGPLLMLQGAVDAATVIERALSLRDTYRGAAQTWAEFSTGAHGSIESTPTNAGEDCGRKIWLQFLDNPRAAIDTSCTKDLAPIRFDGMPSTNRMLFGVADGWDG